VLVGGTALAFVIVIALLAGTGTGGRLDPRSFAPAGTHALAQLLRDRGTDFAAVDGVETGDSVVVLPFPDAMSLSELTLLRGSGTPVVALAPSGDTLQALTGDVREDGPAPVVTRSPGCALPAATAAGRARLGGTSFADGDTSCYDGTLVRSGNVTVTGSSDFLTNERLADDGNAALALNLLSGERVLWVTPAAGTGEGRGLLSLLPGWVRPALLQLGVALAVLGLWRARRLGRVVTEPLPVVVRAAETVEGRGRLYQVTRSRDRASEELRGSSRDSAARHLGLGTAPDRAAVVEASATALDRPPGEVESLLYGPVPADDDALVRLADALSRFDSEVSRT
jgi:hypothetical protein